MKRLHLFTVALCLVFATHFARGQTPSVSGSIPSTGGGAGCVSVSTDGQGGVGVSVTGTWSGTLQPQISIGGDAAQNVQVTPYNSTVAQSTITASGAYTVNVVGAQQFQLCGNTVSSGTANVKLNVVKLAAGSRGGGSGLFTTPVALKIPATVTGLNGYGDSLTAGVQVQTGQLSQIWFNLISLSWNVPIGTNFAVSGTRINATGQIASAYTQTPTAATASLMILGTNEMVDGTNSGNRTQIGNAQLAMFAWLALPASQRILATAMTQAGTWATTTDFGLTSEFSQTNNATLTTASPLTGTACYVAGTWGTGIAPWNFDVLIDGVSQTAGAGFQLTYGLSLASHYPYALRFAGLSNTAHTIQVKALSATAAVADVQWVGCNGATAPGIFVFDGGTMFQSGVTSANTVAMNTVTAGLIANLATDGLSVFYVDDYGAVSPAGNCPVANPPVYNQDCIHPNVLGNEVIAGRWLDTLGSAPVTATQMIASEKAYLSSNSPPPNSVGSNTGCNAQSGTAANGYAVNLIQYSGSTSAGVGNSQWTCTPVAKGSCTFAAATTCSIVYSTAFTSTPLIFITPINPGAVTFVVSASSNAGFTITASGANSLVVNFEAVGDPT